jgi:hypothetical protein
MSIGGNQINGQDAFLGGQNGALADFGDLVIPPEKEGYEIDIKSTDLSMPNDQVAIIKTQGCQQNQSNFSILILLTMLGFVSLLQRSNKN